MRVSFFTLAALSGAILAGSAANAAVDADMTFKPQTATSDSDALAKCGPKPTEPGGWNCVGAPSQKSGPRDRKAGGDPTMTWTWVKGGAPPAGGTGWSGGGGK